jgi:hypothetical protein
VKNGENKDVSEKKILDAINKKGKVMKNITIEQSNQGVVFPCDYKTFEES